MDIIAKLNGVLLQQDFTKAQMALYQSELDKYKKIAYGYANIENCISVLSDMHTNSSYIYYGEFSKILGFNHTKAIEDKINSIWENNILKLIHPEDLYEKYLQELRFFHFIKHQPKKKRSLFFLANALRIKDISGNYLDSLHRLFYIPSFFDQNMWLALCLYSPITYDLPHKYIIVNTLTGQLSELGKRNNATILSEREIQVLRLIDKGLMSKNIAEFLSISINTVSRHRQKILEKLHVKNSIEACHIAKKLGIF